MTHIIQVKKSNLIIKYVIHPTHSQRFFLVCFISHKARQGKYLTGHQKWEWHHTSVYHEGIFTTERGKEDQHRGGGGADSSDHTTDTFSGCCLLPPPSNSLKKSHSDIQSGKKDDINDFYT